MHVWYIDAGIEDTPEPVYTHCLVIVIVFVCVSLRFQRCIAYGNLLV